MLLAKTPEVETTELKPPTESKPTVTPRSPIAGPTARGTPGGDTKESFDERKKQLMASGPHIRSDQPQHSRYGMDESMFTSLKDLFEAILAHPSATGVVVPQKFMDLLRLKHADYRGAAHQDAHEFLNMLLNEVVEEVETYSKTSAKNAGSLQLPSPVTKVLEQQQSWIRDLFEGVLTSETRCLTCENVSQRDEIFLDLSVDLEEHSSVSSSLQKFSEEEMLREKNKFHCDTCCGLQEAEKRLKIRKLPRTLALHLKRFKFVEEIGNMQKLFHKVVFPFYLRLFNTTEDTEDPDRLYELYAVIVHLGSTPFHGHYVSIIKTKSKGWVLFDDELVIPVDTNYVRNFFGGQRSPACAYVLFYQQISAEVALREQNDDQDLLAALAQTNEVLDNGILSPTTPAVDDGVFNLEPKSPGLAPTSAEERDFIARLENPAAPRSDPTPIPVLGRLTAKRSGEMSFELPASVTSVFKSKDSKKSSELSESTHQTEPTSEDTHAGELAASPEKAGLGRHDSKRANGLSRLRTTSFSTRRKGLFGSSKNDSKNHEDHLPEHPVVEQSPEKQRPGSSANAAERHADRPDSSGQLQASPTRAPKHDTQKSSLSKFWHRNSDKHEKNVSLSKDKLLEDEGLEHADQSPDSRADKPAKSKSRFLGRKKSSNLLL